MKARWALMQVIASTGQDGGAAAVQPAFDQGGSSRGWLPHFSVAVLSCVVPVLFAVSAQG